MLEYVQTDNDKAMQVIDQAFEVALELGDTAKIVRTRRNKGQLLNRVGRSKEALDVSIPYLDVARRNNLRGEVKIILNNIAVAHTVLADYEKALETHLQSLALREEDGDKREISTALNNIGFIYFKLKNYNSALDYFNRSLETKLETESTSGLDRIHINIGLCYNQLRQFSLAFKHFESAFEVCGGDCHPQIILEGEFGLGVSQYSLAKYSAAMEHFRRSYRIAKDLNQQRFEAENLIYFAHIHLKTSDLDSALYALKQCEAISIAGGYKELLLSCYKEYATIYNLTQDHENASTYQQKYIDLKDSVYSSELLDNLAKIQTQYAQRENLATIAAKEDIIRRQRSLNAAIVIIAVLAASLVFVLYRSNRVKKKVNLALSEAKAIIEDQNRQLLSSNYHLNRELHEKNEELQRANESLIRVNEELDNFIYKTSHDIRGPLASLKGMCNVALMDVKDALALDYLHKLDITAEKLNTILTRLLIVNQINNSTLGNERIDFTGIVNDVLTLERKKGLPPRLKIHCDIDENIDFHSDKQFVRIIMENLIDNAIKFYNDSERIEPFVKISVSERNHHVQIKVVDNGIGISQVHPDKIFQMFSRASERSETGGIGLYITKTATEKLGGSVHLATTLEGYTEFFVTLPLVQQRVVA